MAATDEPIASTATDHHVQPHVQPSYLSLPSTAPQRQQGGRSLGGAQRRGSWWLGWWLEWGKWNLQGEAELTQVLCPRSLLPPSRGRKTSFQVCSFRDISWSNTCFHYCPHHLVRGASGDHDTGRLKKCMPRWQGG